MTATTEASLPQEYEVPQTPSNYFKLQKGNNRLRIVSPIKVGWEHWIDEGEKRKPIRSRTPLGKEKEKHFWVFCAYDYADENVKVLEITQKGIQEFMRNVMKLPNKALASRYDFYITKSWEGLDTSYTVTNSDNDTELPEQIVKAIEVAKGIDLEAFLDWKENAEIFGGLQQQNDDDLPF